MPDDSTQLRRISWRDVCPWLIIFRCLGTSIGISLLTLATAAALLVPCGWAVADLLFQPEQFIEQFQQPRDGRQRPQWHERILRPNLWEGSAPRQPYQFPDELSDLGTQFRVSVERFFSTFTGYWAKLFSARRTARDTASSLFIFLWTLLVWAFCGGAITRIAVVKLGRYERVGLWDAMRHTFRKYTSYVGAPLLPLIGIVFGLLCFCLLGMLMWSNVGVVIAAIFWPLALVGAFLLTVLLLGLIFGWPFMWVALGAEADGDALDAISHAYTYALWRPLRYLGYATVALLVGAFGWLIVYHASEIMLSFIRAGVLWAAGSARADDLAWIFDPHNHTPPDSNLLWFGGWIIRLLNGLVRTIASAYIYSFLFCAASAMYLLLRYDNEHTEFDEVLVEDEESLQLPDVKQPAAVVPPAIPGEVPAGEPAAGSEPGPPNSEPPPPAGLA